jgi:outer membrane lipoprotein SlyB
MKTRLSLVVLALAIGWVSAGCTFPSSRRVIPRSQAGVMQVEQLGTVTSVREVNIEGEKSNLGLIGGAVVGGAATRPSPGNNSRGGALVQAGGVVAGAVAGQAIEEVATRRRAQEITVRLDDGRTVVVTQEVAGGLYQDGDRVRVLNSGGGARVSMSVDGR